MRVLFCGDRYWKNVELIRDYINRLEPHDIVISGGAPGADEIAYELAKKKGLATFRFPAQWNLRGKAAGPIRNHRMLDEGQPDLVYAFHNYIQNSRGTKNMVSLAQAIGCEVVVVTEDEHVS